MTQSRIENLIESLSLKPHPEGGYYNEEYRSNLSLTSPTANEQRVAMSHIYYLMPQGQISRWHKVLHDEIWNVYEGDPLRILTFDGLEVEETFIGHIGREVQNNYYKVVPRGYYQAAETTGLYTLLGCTVAPGFTFDDFFFLEDPKLKAVLQSKEGDYTKFI
ncbi:cupin domain-containing protein [Glaciecola sp. 1036]|uniref:cupin domain-containing protein n=1 Tax=Alteromonadaceae TaxID=72275 RepID=UPI003D051E28